jgi:large subunit ribosomal protein L6
LSRVGKEPINIPENVEVNVVGNKVTVKGPKGELSREVHPEIIVRIEDNTIFVERPNDTKFFSSIHGLYRALINNMVVGVSEGFSKILSIVGIGYKAELKGKALVLSLGFSHPVGFMPPPGINFTLNSPTEIVVSGIDKELVGKLAGKIRNVRPPEPYKGKGVRYKGEQVKRKAGKTTA